MSCKIPKVNLTHEEILKIKNDCFIEGNVNEYGPTKTLEAYGETSKNMYIPFEYYRKKYGVSPNKDNDFWKSSYDRKMGFKDQEQEDVFNQAIKHIKKYRNILLSLRTGFGKTFTAITLAQTSGYKAAVLAHAVVLIDQWVESIHKFSTAKVQVVKTDGVLDPEADIYIFNTGYVHKKWDKADKKWVKKQIGIYKQIGVLIIDEAHIACAEEMSKSMLYFQPRINIALTATPKRKDGMDKILDLYFGGSNIIKIATTPFDVYRLPTNFKPQFSYNSMGKKDWNSVINSISFQPIRNNLIVHLCKKFSEKTILILGKRIDQCNIIVSMLSKNGIEATKMIGSDRKYDKTARILISTFSKLGTGFDDSRLDMLILACDVVEVEQYAGRLRHSEEKHRIIIDLVDNDYNCASHWRTRKKWYLSRKGIISEYFQKFPEDRYFQDKLLEVNGGNKMQEEYKQQTYKRLAPKAKTK